MSYYYPYYRYSHFNTVTLVPSKPKVLLEDPESQLNLQHQE